MEKLYTFILNFDGGIYISQKKGTQLHEVFKNWIEDFDFSQIPMENKFHKIEDVDTDIVPLDGLINVWCSAFLLSKIFALVHVVETEENIAIIKNTKSG